SRLVSGLEFINRPRFSTLSHTGAHKIMRLPRRSAVVAFSVSEVYRIAELLRRFRGGAAVVMGALSPRTRNAQVALYQAGEVDYLVATDAIGMGLNLALDHVAFAGARKYDGREARELNPAEVAQIAGRAGRHTRHGTFGTTLNAPAFEPEVVSAVEDHLFKPVRTLFWRNADLDLSSLPALLRSLEAPPPVRELMRPRETEDVASLRALAALPDIAAMASGHDAVSLLWDVCRIPDFRKTMADAHFQLLATIFRHLMSGEGLLPKAWVERMVDQLDRSEGDIDGLATRIAHVRTWNYIAQRPRWVADPRALRERARAIEDKLSDALHERLTQRFVDRKTTRLTRRMRESGSLIAAITRSGEVVVEGEYVGRLLGFDLVPDDAETWREGRALRAAVRSALAPEIRKRAGSLVSDEDEAFTLATDGTVSWRDSPVARLARGAQSLSPGLKLLVGDLVEDASRRRVEQRLSTWLAGHIAE
ncbi:MAG: helicase-related protein, partial [Alphaproteobacteria bacterium]|nr:helicase-related protein [Alphaproteobacteria bacterium]